jgi:hypothetical protein
MLMVRNLCQLALLFSVQDHKQSLCHFTFYLYFNDLCINRRLISSKAAKAFRLLANKAASAGQRLPHPGNALNISPAVARTATHQAITGIFDKHSH